MSQSRPKKHVSIGRLRLLYVMGDAVAAVIVWLTYLIYRWTITNLRPLTIEDAVVPALLFYMPLIIYPIVSVLVHYLTGFYLNLVQISRLRELGKTFVSTLILSLLLFFFCNLNDIDTVDDYNRYYLFLFTLVLIQFTVSFSIRWLLGIYRHRLYRKRLLSRRTIVIGTGPQADRIMDELRQQPCQFELIGQVSLTESEHQRLSLLGTLDNLEDICQSYDVQSVVVALPSDYRNTELYQIINRLYHYQIDIQFTPRVYEMLTGAVRIRRPDMSPLVNITEQSMPDWQLCVKRAFDITASSLALLITSPLLILCAIGIRIDSPGPVLFKQDRIGLHGKTFHILKLRTMCIDAEPDGHPHLSLPNDPRITRIGRWMRRYRIDELPQFWNVIVGYRPERQYFIDQIMKQAPYYCLLYKTRPGITSWGPIRLGYAQGVETMIERLNYDIIYIENMSLTEDIKIMLYTIQVILRGKGQ